MTTPTDRAAKLAEIREIDRRPERTFGPNCYLDPREQALRDAIAIIDEMARENASATAALDDQRNMFKALDGPNVLANARLGAALRPHLPALRCFVSHHDDCNICGTVEDFRNASAALAPSALAPLVEQEGK